MNQTIMSQYMAHLNIHLIESHQNMVYPNWRETNEKLIFSKLYYIIEGDGFVTIDDVTYHPVAGDVIYIPQGSTISYGTISPKRYTKYWCHFSAHIGATSLGDFLNFPLLIKSPDNHELTNIFDRLCLAYKDPSAFAPLKSNAILLELLYYYLNTLCHNQVSLKPQSTKTKLNDLLIYMETNLKLKPSIDDFAKEVNLHPNYLIRFFKETFGASPMEYFNRMKIEKAKDLLAIDNEPIKVISSNLGYSTPYYFSSVFKKQTGYTPKDYRKTFSDLKIK